MTEFDDPGRPSDDEIDAARNELFQVAIDWDLPAVLLWIKFRSEDAAATVWADKLTRDYVNNLLVECITATSTDDNSSDDPEHIEDIEPPADPRESLRLALRQNELRARGRPGGVPPSREIPAEQWEELRFFASWLSHESMPYAQAVMDGEDYCSGAQEEHLFGDGIGPKWKHLRFERDQVLRVWPPSDATPLAVAKRYILKREKDGDRVTKSDVREHTVDQTKTTAHQFDRSIWRALVSWRPGLQRPGRRRDRNRN